MATARMQAPEFPGDIEWFNVDRSLSLAALRGWPVLLDFSLDSTDASRDSLDELNRLADRFGQELIILCVYQAVLPAARRRSHIMNLISRHHVRFPVLRDAGGLCRASFGLHGLPARVLIDREGCIVGCSQGAGKLQQLERVILHQLGPGTDRDEASVPFRQADAVEPHGVLCFPTRLLVAHDRIYLADSGNHRILMMSKQGLILRVYGGGGAGFIDGEAASAAFDNPQGMFWSKEFLYVADTGNHAIRRINLRTDEVETVAGTGSAGGQDLSRLSRPRDCALNAPCDVLLHGDRLYIAMSGLHQIWRLSLVENALGIFAGSGEPASRDGTAHQAGFRQPVALAWCDGRLYCVDATGCAVRCIEPAGGRVSTLPGFGEGSGARHSGRMGDTLLQYPFDIETATHGNLLWIADCWNNRILAVDYQGRRAARSIGGRRLNEPSGLALDGDTLYIANTNAHEVLRVDTVSGQAQALNVIEEYSPV